MQFWRYIFIFFENLIIYSKKKKNDLISFLTLTIGHLSQNFKLCQEFEINLFSFKIVTTTTSTTTTTTTRTTTTISTTTTSTTSTTKTCKKFENKRCFYDWAVLISVRSRETAESCLNACMEIEECKNFMIYNSSSGSCLLFRVDVNE